MAYTFRMPSDKKIMRTWFYYFWWVKNCQNGSVTRNFFYIERAFKNPNDTIGYPNNDTNSTQVRLQMLAQLEQFIQLHARIQ